MLPLNIKKIRTCNKTNSIVIDEEEQEYPIAGIFGVQYDYKRRLEYLILTDNGESWWQKLPNNHLDVVAFDERFGGIIASLPEIHKSRFEIPIPELNSDGTWRCPHAGCGYISSKSNLVNMQEHILAAKDHTNTFSKELARRKCEFCSESFAFLRRLKHHIQRKHMDRKRSSEDNNDTNRKRMCRFRLRHTTKSDVALNYRQI